MITLAELKFKVCNSSKFEVVRHYLVNDCQFKTIMIKFFSYADVAQWVLLFR